MTEGLAHLVKIIAEVDRGALSVTRESSAAAAERERPRRRITPRELPTDEVVEICDAYYQRLIHAAQYEKARKTLRSCSEAPNVPSSRSS